MPLAVDTNILARALTDDGTEQARRSSACFRDNDILVIDTVLLETEWLLRSRLKVPRAEVHSLFSALLSWPNVTFADRTRIVNSVMAHSHGLDFADAMHLFAARECEAILTFDDDFIRRSRKIADAVAVRKP